jgi:hypothetical protein
MGQGEIRKPGVSETEDFMQCPFPAIMPLSKSGFESPSSGNVPVGGPLSTRLPGFAPVASLAQTLRCQHRCLNTNPEKQSRIETF